MTKSSILWGAGLTFALGGVVAGNALGSTPVLDRPTIGAFFQSHDDSAFLDRAKREPLPDHYPLVTRSGTVPVAELRMRGLYSQARYRAYAAVSDYGPVATDYEPAQDIPRYETADESVRIGDPAYDAAPVAAAPLQFAARPGSVETEGSAKLIDVQAVLAMR